MSITSRQMWAASPSVEGLPPLIPLCQRREDVWRAWKAPPMLHSHIAFIVIFYILYIGVMSQ